jgi:integrase
LTPEGKIPVKVSVYARQTNNGKRSYEKANPKTKYPLETTFVLRYGNPQKWETIISSGPVPCDVKHAFTRAKIKEAELETHAAYAEEFPATPKPQKQQRKEVEVVIALYLKGCATTLAPKSVSGKKHTLAEWRKVCTKTYLDELDKNDLLAFVTRMKEEGLSDRTCHNRIESVTSFLLARKKICPLGMAIHNKEVRVKVKYTEKTIKAYTPAELKKLFDAACHDEWELFQFFLCSGFRDAEVQTICWEDLGADGIVKVHDHPEFGFKPKDAEEWEVPLPDYLVARLEEMRQSGGLIFPTEAGKPNAHFLRSLKRLAERAGLDPDTVELHKFRKTYATLQHRDGVDARTIQKRLGHSDLSTTLAYLEGEEPRSVRSRKQVNGTFGAFA